MAETLIVYFEEQMALMQQKYSERELNPVELIVQEF